MTAHVPRERLDEIGQADTLSKQPEWSHIRECTFCSNQLLEFVRNNVEAQRESIDAMKQIACRIQPSEF